jgi:hypothetical protein
LVIRLQLITLRLELHTLKPTTCHNLIPTLGLLVKNSKNSNNCLTMRSTADHTLLRSPPIFRLSQSFISSGHAPGVWPVNWCVRP